jgi:repressor LexA
MLTPKMLQLYKLMDAYKAKNGYMPSYDEMADMMGLHSKSGINRLICSMEQRGAIKRIPNQARAIRLLPLQ